MNARHVASRVYRLAIGAFPPHRRSVYGGEMIDAFERALDDRRVQGRARAALFVLAACLDAIRAGLEERRRSARRLLLASIADDLVHAGRSLLKARGFTFVCVASLGLGMGAVFALLGVTRVATGAPPGVKTERLVELVVLPQDALRSQVGDWAIDTWTYPDFIDLLEADTGMSLTAWTPAQSVVRLPDGTGLRVDSMYASPNYFAVVGAPLALGPGFNDADFAPAEVIVSTRFWQSRLASRPDVVGTTLVVGGAPHTIVGVAPEHFRGHLALHRPGFQLWLPLREHFLAHGPQSRRFDRSADWLRLLGRLSPGSSVAEANARVSSVMAGLAERYPASHRLKAAAVEPYAAVGARRRFDAVAEAVTVVIGAAVVLLVVCLNLSGMMLVRSATRERELAVRLAIGANRPRLIQYLLAEALVLAIAGGAIAATIAFGTPAALAWWFGASPDELPQIDRITLAVCIAVCFAASLLFGLLPALRFSRPSVMFALKDETVGGRRVGRVHRWTVGIQAGIAVPFIVMAAVQLDQVRRTTGADLGFRPTGLFVAPVDARAAATVAQDPAFLLRMVQSAIERGPGVTAVTAADGMPLDLEMRDTRVVRAQGIDAIRARATRVSPGFFDTLGIALVRGRGITASDRAGAESVVVISETLERRLFPDGAALGARLTLTLDRDDSGRDRRWSHVSSPSAEQTFTVVGVVADVVDAYLGPPRPQLFVPLAQHPAARAFVIVRSSSSLEAMAAAFEIALRDWSTDADVVRASVTTGDDLVRRSRAELAFGSTLGGAAAVVALMLEALGIFGVVGFMVATRTREIGIRIALGATRQRVLGRVLADAVKVAAPGVVLGLLLAFAAAGELAWASQATLEPIIYGCAAAIALGVALFAGVPAACRAAAVEPIVAMRAE